jgi:hypothetical protein
MVQLDVSLEGVQAWTDLPAGVYKAEMIRSEEWNNSYHSGVAMTWAVLDGPQAGQTTVDRVILYGDNERAREVGLRKLKEMSMAMGYHVSHIRDSEELEGKPVVIVVGYGKKGTEYETRTQISKWYPLAEYENALARYGGDPQAKANATPPPRQAPPATRRQAPPPSREATQGQQPWDSAPAEGYVEPQETAPGRTPPPRRPPKAQDVPPAEGRTPYADGRP